MLEIAPEMKFNWYSSLYLELMLVFDIINKSIRIPLSDL